MGWVSHLYYWIYPGIMVAFTGTLTVYILGLLGVTLSTPLEVGAAVLFAILTGAIAFRGIAGSTMTAIVINVIQLTALVAFSLLAVVFRLTHPDAGYVHPERRLGRAAVQHLERPVPGHHRDPAPGRVRSVTALGAEAIDPKRDVRRAVLLSLAIQGGIAYLIEYVATNLFVNTSVTATVTGADGTTSTVTGYAAAAASGAPIGDMIQFIGDHMLGGTGVPLALVMAATVLVALIGTTLACLNTGVRITYVMGRDREVPGILGLLHGRYATPHYGVLALAGVSAVIGAYGVLSADNLLQRRPRVQHRDVPRLRDDQRHRDRRVLASRRS